MVEISQDQAEAMQEKLKNMSPEELREFQKKQCIFCRIIAGGIPSKKIYSDEKCTALLDINPASEGHILLLPNEHYSIMPLVPADELNHLFMVAKALAQASLKALEAQGTNIFIANGTAAGQKAQHFMIHIIPRKEGDNVNISIPEKAMSESDAKQIIDRLKPAVTKALGPGKEEKPSEEEKAPPEEKGEKEEGRKEAAPKKPEKAPEGKFVTSEKARRFHSPGCPFAQKIPEDSRIYISEDEAEETGKLPCGCTGLKKKKPAQKKAEEPEEAEEDIGGEEPEEEVEEEPEETEEDIGGEEPEEEKKEGETSLDDISSMLTGGK